MQQFIRPSQFSQVSGLQIMIILTLHLDNQFNCDGNICNCIVIKVSAGGLIPLGAKASVNTVTTKFGTSRVNAEWGTIELNVYQI